MNKLCIVVVLLHISEISYNIYDSYKAKHVCVIGAGIAGLSSARYLKEAGINFTVLEATQYVGGTWRYDPRTGTDENGLSIHTSMYENLRTNLPKPVMGLRGFSVPESWPSFPSGKQIHSYLQDYANHFDIIKHIKFLHKVILVSRKNKRWKVKYKNVLTKEEFDEEFDYVIVCNGMFSKPVMPNITGENLFKGTIIHSHDYRKTNPYKDRRLLIVGAGPSAMDIALNVAEVSKYLIHSHHEVQTALHPPNYVKKPDVKEFNETGAIFVDDSFEEVDDVIYCTGYQNDYSFLDESSGLTIEPKLIYPLYQYMVNIKEPSMFIMGQIVQACIVVGLDAQARYVTALINGNFKLPSENEMMKQWEVRMAAISAKKMRSSFIHVLGEEEDEYYARLTVESGIERVPPVAFKIRTKSNEARFENFHTFRDYEYIISDEHNFTRKLLLKL